MAATEYGNVPGIDLTFKNFGASAIEAGLAVLVDGSNVIPTNAVGGIVLPTASGGVAGTLGVTVERIPAGGIGRVRVAGVIQCKANGTVTYGQIVQASDTTAKLGWVKTCGAGTRQIGLALATAADGEFLPVLIAHAVNA
jgi:hypothetical protein